MYNLVQQEIWNEDKREIWNEKVDLWKLEAAGNQAKFLLLSNMEMVGRPRHEIWSAGAPRSISVKSYHAETHDKVTYNFVQPKNSNSGEKIFHKIISWISTYWRNTEWAIWRWWDSLVVKSDPIVVQDESVGDMTPTHLQDLSMVIWHQQPVSPAGCWTCVSYNQTLGNIYHGHSRTWIWCRSPWA